MNKIQINKQKLSFLFFNGGMIVAQLKQQQAETTDQIMMNGKEECTTKPWHCQIVPHRDAIQWNLISVTLRLPLGQKNYKK